MPIDLSLEALNSRRVGHSLILLHKLLSDSCDLNVDNLIPISSDIFNTRENCLKINIEQFDSANRRDHFCRVSKIQMDHDILLQQRSVYLKIFKITQVMMKKCVC